jgi:hypothetical protein
VIGRAAVAALALAVAAPVRADSTADPRAVQAADEANLESNAPRSGITLSASLGGGLVIGGNGGGAGDTGVGRGPSLSLRIGHVATRDTVLTFELTGGSRFHQAAVSGSPLYHDDDFNLMAGALTYVAPSLWLRGAGGLSVISFDDSMGTKARPGFATLFGLGIDFVRWRKLVLGLESWGILSVVAVRGVVLDTGLCLGLSYY